MTRHNAGVSWIWVVIGIRNIDLRLIEDAGITGCPAIDCCTIGVGDLQLEVFFTFEQIIGHCRNADFDFSHTNRQRYLAIDNFQSLRIAIAIDISHNWCVKVY